MLLLRSSVKMMVMDWVSASAALGRAQVPGHVALLRACNGATRKQTPMLAAAVQHLSSSAAPQPRLAAAAAARCQAQYCASSCMPNSSTLCTWPPANRHSARHLSTVTQQPHQRSPSSAVACEASAAQQQPSVSMTYDTTPTPRRPLARKLPVDMNAEERLQCLREKAISELGWDPGRLVLVGDEHTARGLCFECGNGSHGEDCFAFTVKADEFGKAELLTWFCHRATCGNSGTITVHKDSTRVEGALQMREAAKQQAQSFGLPSVPPPASPPLLPPQQQQQPSQLHSDAGPASSVPPPSGSPPSQQQQQQQQQIQQRRQSLRQQQPPQQLGTRLQPLTPDLIAWFQERGISTETLQRNNVQMERRYCGALQTEADHIAFPYYRDGAMVNIKYRALPKHFSQVKGGQQILYGYDEARGADEIVIVEGEMDKLAIEEALLRTQLQQQQQEAVPGGPADTQAVAVAGATPAAAGAPQSPLFFGSKRGGRLAVVSVPAGAPSRVSGPASSQERKFKFLDDCSDILTAAKRVVLAVDSDQPGLVLATELARRVGREKCLVATWPTSRAPVAALQPQPAVEASDTATTAADAAADAGAGTSTDVDAGAGAVVDWARKDANEVLMRDGPAALRACIDDAKALPVKGLYQFNDYWKEVLELYEQGAAGLSWGVSTGWSSVDAFYKVVPGELTIVTGLPNSGKSEWLDALVVNLADREGWSIGICSLENTPKEHGRKLMEKYTGKAFFDAEYAVGISKMTYRDVLDALTWLDERFHLIRPPKHTMPTIEYILDKARAAVLRYGIRGLIIDPYNELDPRRGNMFETEYVSRTLTKIKRFAQHYDCHIWFVAHPRSQRGMGLGGGMSTLSAPSMYDISGSAHFINKADNGIVIHRPYTGAHAEAEGKNTRQTQILVRKVRNKLAGRIGDVALSYDTATGRYLDMQEQS